MLLTSWAALAYLLALDTARGGLKLAALIMVLAAFVFGLIAAAGQIVLFDPLTTGGLSFGMPALGLACFLAGLAVLRDGGGTAPNRPPGRVGLVLILVAVLGMFTLPLRPLIYALELLPLAFGAAEFALFGGGWIILGVTLRNEPARDRQPICGLPTAE